MEHGVLVIDKPPGLTSHDVVSSVRRSLHQRQVGHAGTLDPAATGVLPLLLGEATKLSRFLTGREKRYVGTIRLGRTTDTMDADGTVVREREVCVTTTDIAQVLGRFRGEIEQLPPMYSAKKVGGKKLYELARKGQEVEREPVPVRITRLESRGFSTPDLELEVVCSAGTYVRALAHDIGEALGCGGHLLRLCRTASGSFTLEDAVELQELVDDPALARRRILPLRRAVRGFPLVSLSDPLPERIRCGHQLTVGELRNLESPGYHMDDFVVLTDRRGDPVAMTTALHDSARLDRLPPGARGLKTERVLQRVATERDEP